MLVFNLIISLGPWVVLIVAVVMFSRARRAKRENERSQELQEAYEDGLVAGRQEAGGTNRAGLEGVDKLSVLWAKMGKELAKVEPDIDFLRRLQEQIGGEEVQVAMAPAQVGGAVAQQAVFWSAQDGAIAGEKKETYGGLNAILYVGSFLIVAGGGALIMSAVSDAVKMMILSLMVVIFYVGGLVIRRDERLQAAGKAFVGTALAIIPFLGLAFAGFTGMAGELAWLLTSVIGVVAYVVATIKLESRVVAYLSMAFVVSMVCSMSATLGLPIIYYFAFVMGLGIIVGLAQLFAADRVQEVFAGVVRVTGRWLSIVALLASFCVAPEVQERFLYSALFIVATMQILLVWAKERTRQDELMLRIVTHASVLVVAFELVDGDMLRFGGVFWVAAGLQALLCMWLASRREGRVQMEEMGI